MHFKGTSAVNLGNPAMPHSRHNTDYTIEFNRNQMFMWSKQVLITRLYEHVSYKVELIREHNKR